MRITLSERVKTTLGTLSRDDRERVHAWFGHLENWEQDEFVKSHSVALTVRGQPVYMFRTSTEVRIFYSVHIESRTIHVIDVTTKDTILSSGAVTVGERA